MLDINKVSGMQIIYDAVWPKSRLEFEKGETGRCALCGGTLTKERELWSKYYTNSFNGYSTFACKDSEYICEACTWFGQKHESPTGEVELDKKTGQPKIDKKTGLPKIKKFSALGSYPGGADTIFFLGGKKNFPDMGQMYRAWEAGGFEMPAMLFSYGDYQVLHKYTPVWLNRAMTFSPRKTKWVIAKSNFGGNTSLDMTVEFDTEWMSEQVEALLEHGDEIKALMSLMKQKDSSFNAYRIYEKAMQDSTNTKLLPAESLAARIASCLLFPKEEEKVVK